SFPESRWLRRSEEHTSELQSLAYLVCRLLLEKKKHISAIQTQRDAGAHLGHVGFHEIRVGARRTRLDAVQASVDRRRDPSDSKRTAVRRGRQHFPCVGHPTTPNGGTRHGRGSSFTDSSKAFFFKNTPTTEIYTLSLHDALPISSFPESRWLR